jgi:RNA polymerase sigma-70 factor, ECF subfamily
MNPTFDRHTANQTVQAMNSPARQALETVWRLEAPRITARVARLVGDLDTAEELTQDTFLTALQRWETSGIPDNPAAWLMTTARFLAIDLLRRRDTQRTKYQAIANTQHDMIEPNDTIDEGPLGDDLLGLIYMACHPVLSPDARTALTLKHLCGLTTGEIAHAFLSSEPTIAQRIVRAKRTLAAANVRFELPEPAERTARLGSVLEVIYLVFNEGYAATAGDQWIRAELCHEATRLGRMLAAIVGDDTETLGLLALMELQASRLAARVGPDGQAILLLDQDRTRWDRLLIRRGLDALTRINKLGGSTGPYALQAAIAACHARATQPGDTDWPMISALYDALAQITPSPVIELNRAVAIGYAFGPAEGLAVAEPLRQHPATKDHHLLAAVRADLLCKHGQHDQARDEFLRSAALTRNTRDRTVMLERAAQCAIHQPSH